MFSLQVLADARSNCVKTTPICKRDVILGCLTYAQICAHVQSLCQTTKWSHAVRVMKYCLKRDSWSDFRSVGHLDLVCWAIQHNKLALMKLWTVKKYFVIDDLRGSILFNVACWNGSVKMVRFFIHQGFNLDDIRKYYSFTMHIASRGSYEKFMMFESQHSIKRPVHTFCYDHQTCIEQQQNKENHINIVNMLVEQGFTLEDVNKPAVIREVKQYCDVPETTWLENCLYNSKKRKRN